jgi:hypothetical protein
MYQKRVFLKKITIGKPITVNRETRNAYGILGGGSSHFEDEEGGRYILLTWMLEKWFVKIERGNRTG